MNSESFFPTINYPTRITNHSATIIDNIFVNCYHHIIDPTIVISDFSDHFPLVLWLKNTYDVLSDRKPQKHAIINDALIEQFSSRLEQTNWEKVVSAISEGDTKLAYNRFIEDYMKQYNDIFLKVRNNQLKTTPRKIWMTQGLLISWKIKNKLYLKSKKYPTEVNIGNYKNYRNKLSKLLNVIWKECIMKENLLSIHRIVKILGD